MKKILAIILSIVMISSLAAAFADNKQPARAENEDEQIKLLFDSLETLVPKDDKLDWVIGVTDLDANGRLELIATCISGSEHKSQAKFYELSEDFKTATELTTDAADDGTFTDILADSADTYFDAKTDTYYYMFSDNTFLNQNEFFATKCSISLKDGNVVHKEYAREHTEIYNGITAIEYTDLSGAIITPEEFSSAGNNEFAGLEKSGRNFGWVSAKDVKELYQLEDSYAIFLGEKEPDKGIKKPEETPQIVDPGFLWIYKNPTSEYIKEGETAWFIANAYNWDSLVWTFVSPDGGQYSVQNFKKFFPHCSVSGVSGTSLTVDNVSLDMNGWGAFCTFYGNSQTARSNTAYIYVSTKPVPTPKPTDEPVTGIVGGYVSDFLMSSVTIQLDNGGSVQVLKDVCDVVGGDLDYGCRCTVYFVGGYPTLDNVTYVRIEGREPVPEVDPVIFEPITESMEEALKEGTFDLETNYLSDLEIPEDWEPPEE